MQIPGYEILEKIGEGGSRVAYLARREFCTEPTVVKVFRTGDIHERIEDQRGRHTLKDILTREVEMLRRFSHPNLIRIFNHGEVDDTFFIEEEFMDGGTAADTLKHLEEYEGVNIFRDMAQGVRFLHSRNILVRDLKLNNALL